MQMSSSGCLNILLAILSLLDGTLAMPPRVANLEEASGNVRRRENRRVEVSQDVPTYYVPSGMPPEVPPRDQQTIQFPSTGVTHNIVSHDLHRPSSPPPGFPTPQTGPQEKTHYITKVISQERTARPPEIISPDSRHGRDWAGIAIYPPEGGPLQSLADGRKVLDLGKLRLSHDANHQKLEEEFKHDSNAKTMTRTLRVKGVTPPPQTDRIERAPWTREAAQPRAVDPSQADVRDPSLEHHPDPEAGWDRAPSPTRHGAGPLPEGSLAHHLQVHTPPPAEHRSSQSSTRASYSPERYNPPRVDARGLVHTEEPRSRSGERGMLQVDPRSYSGDAVRAQLDARKKAMDLISGRNPSPPRVGVRSSIPEGRNEHPKETAEVHPSSIHSPVGNAIRADIEAQRRAAKMGVQPSSPPRQRGSEERVHSGEAASSSGRTHSTDQSYSPERRAHSGASASTSGRNPTPERSSGPRLSVHSVASLPPDMLARAQKGRDRVKGRVRVLQPLTESSLRSGATEAENRMPAFRSTGGSLIGVPPPSPAPPHTVHPRDEVPPVDILPPRLAPHIPPLKMLGHPLLQGPPSGMGLNQRKVPMLLRGRSRPPAPEITSIPEHPPIAEDSSGSERSRDRNQKANSASGGSAKASSSSSGRSQEEKAQRAQSKEQKAQKKEMRRIDRAERKSGRASPGMTDEQKAQAKKQQEMADEVLRRSGQGQARDLIGRPPGSRSPESSSSATSGAGKNRQGEAKTSKKPT